MPLVIGETIFLGGKPSDLFPLDHLSLTLKDSAPKFSKRVILTGRVLFLFFSQLLKGYERVTPGDHVAQRESMSYRERT